VLFDIAAHRLHHFGGAVPPDGFGPAAKAGTEAGFFRLVRLAEEGHILTAGPPRWAGRPAIHAGRRDAENKFAILAGVTSHDRLPPQGLTFAAVALGAANHLRRFRQVEYRIGCHNVESLRLNSQVDHPDLAVKARFLNRCYCGGDGI
jgi:hypothetical protein